MDKVYTEFDKGGLDIQSKDLLSKQATKFIWNSYNLWTTIIEDKYGPYLNKKSSARSPTWATLQKLILTLRDYTKWTIGNRDSVNVNGSTIGFKKNLWLNALHLSI